MNYLILFLMAGSALGQTVKATKPDPDADIKIKSVQGVLTPAQQAAFPANAWVKLCGPNNHDDWCVDTSQTKSAPKPEPALDTGLAYAKSCIREGDMGCISVIGITADAHGCMYPYMWDGQSLCAFDLSTPAQGPQKEEVSCTQTTKDDAHHLKCAYKPLSSQEKPK